MKGWLHSGTDQCSLYHPAQQLGIYTWKVHLKKHELSN